MDLAYISASTSVTASTAATLATVAVPGDGSEPGTAVAMVEIDGSVGEALLPRDDRHQLLAMRVQVDGVTVSPHFLVGEITVNQRVDGFADFAFSVPVGDGLERWPLGSPWLLRAPPPGLAAIDIHGLYGTDTGLHAYPLITGGLVNEAEISQVDGVQVMAIRGLGPGSRSQRRTVSLSLLPGHRTRRGTVITTMARSAGVTDTSIEPGRVMSKEVLLESSPWLGTAREIAELDGKYLAWDEEGTLRTYPRLPPEDPAAALVITARDLLLGSFRASWPSDVPTRVTLTTNEQLWDGEVCGRVTTVSTSEVIEVSLPPRAKWRIGGNGGGPWSLDPVVPPSGEEPQPRVVQRVITTTETLCDTVVATKVDTYALKNPEVWRYAIAEATPPGGETQVVLQNRFNYLLDESPQEDALGSESAHVWELARLLLVSEEFTRNDYDDENYKLRTVVSRKGWSFQQWALKQRSLAFVDWETEPLIFPITYTRGGGQSLGNAPADEQYSQGYLGSDIEIPTIAFGQFVARTTTDHFREDGFIVSETVTNEGPTLPAGDEYFYSGGATSRVDREEFGETGSERTIYSPTGESAARKTTSQLDATGELVGSTSEDLDSYLPAAERLIDGSDSSAPPRGNTRLVEESCIATGLEATHPRNDVTRSIALAEDAVDLESLCLQALAEGSLITAELQLPACFGLRKGITVLGVLPRIELRHLMLVKEVTHTASAGGPVVTTVRGVIRAL